jgi:hypothetical protein
MAKYRKKPVEVEAFHFTGFAEGQEEITVHEEDDAAPTLTLALLNLEEQTGILYRHIAATRGYPGRRPVACVTRGAWVVCAKGDPPRVLTDAEFAQLHEPIEDDE